MAKGVKLGTQKFNPEFRFLLSLDPALESWRDWVAQYWATRPKTNNRVQTALNAFLVDYLHGQGLHTLAPNEFFAKATKLPAPDAALKLALTADKRNSNTKHDFVSDFLDWVLLEKFAQPDAKGHRVVPQHLANPFPRRRVKSHGKGSDLSFAHVLKLDPKLEDWRILATEWLKDQKSSVARRRESLDQFLVRYIHGHDLERNFGRFLMRDTKKPDLAKVIIEAKREGKQTIKLHDVTTIAYVADFLDWVLATRLGDPETGEYDRSRFHNPVQRLTKSGLAKNTQSDKTALSIRYIRELRGMLAQGPNFRDWTWAQAAIRDEKGGGGDWFVVDPKIIDPNDPDCVYRRRAATKNELKSKGYPAEVCELWSPVRAVGLSLHLELPLRNMQVRMLDSGEADTYRYIHAPGGGGFVRNHGPLAIGSETRPYQRGVFHRSANEQEAGLYINTNKTSDINKAENDKGYVIPWSHDEALYWLEKLRNWQERYNPLAAPTPWTALEGRHFGRTPPHAEVLAQRGTACFLFRDPTDDERDKPITRRPIDRLWFKLLAALEQRCAGRDRLDNGTPIRFVAGDGTTTFFSLHALRVSLISYFILDLKLPIAVVSKMIAGHATIIMTLYYTKFGKAYMREVMAEAEKNELQAEQDNHRRFLMDATFEEISQRFAYVSEDAVRAALKNRSAAAFVFDDKGICPNGATLCDVGGEKISESKTLNDYAPVPGFPQERNCVCCRFFLSGPAYLDGLMAHGNAVTEKFWRGSKRYNGFMEKVKQLEDSQRSCERNDVPFLKVRELEALSKHAETEATTVSKLRNDLAATYHLLARSIEIANNSQNEGVQLVANGSMTDLKLGFIETTSEFHQLEVVCENAVIHPNPDADFATIRRSQMIDAMLRFNGMDPVLMHLTPEHQLLAGNAVMKLIQARTGSIKDSLPFAECRAKLKNIGLLHDDVVNEIAKISAEVPAKELIDHAKAKYILSAPKEEFDDAS